MQPAPSTPNHDEFGAYDQFDEAITANSPIRPRSLPASSQVDKRTPQGFVVITQADVYTHVFLKLEEEQHVCEQQLLLCASCGQSTLTQSAICALGERLPIFRCIHDRVHPQPQLSSHCGAALYVRAGDQCAGTKQPLLPAAPILAVPRGERLDSSGMPAAVARANVSTGTATGVRHAEALEFLDAYRRGAVVAQASMSSSITTNQCFVVSLCLTLATAYLPAASGSARHSNQQRCGSMAGCTLSRHCRQHE
jgi:hypothetical protein